MLDRALGEAGIDRNEAYVTNAVKHFKFTPRGKIRLHQKPNTTEIRACNPWLQRERAIVKPKLIVALGATAGSILRYFQTENLLIVATGAALGVLLGLAGNLWLLRGISLTRLPAPYLVVGTVVVLALGQISVLWPALRASAVPPAIAARGS